MKTLVIEAPAKINLFLDVKGKRNDGYHELESIMHQINLVDRINIQVDDGITVKSSSPDIPDDEDNLAYQAARLILEKYGQGEGAAIFIEKNIPGFPSIKPNLRVSWLPAKRWLQPASPLPCIPTF
jgi:4-diphosphocytidyl-2-C-methyl-D-erythritol kinase